MTTRNFEFYYGLNPEQKLFVPYYDFSLKATFSGLFSDVVVEHIDLIKELMPRPSSTRCVCAGGTNIKDEKIRSGDYVIMDASLKYKDGKKIAYWLKDHDGWTVKILRIRRDGFYLEPTDPHDSSQFVYKITKYDTPLGMVSWILYKEYHAKVGMFRHGFFPESKEEEVNLEKLLIPRASSTFCAKAGGDSMNDERITNGDILVVDKSLEYLEKKKIVYWLNDYNGFTVKILKISPSGNYLVPANKELYQNFEYKIQEYDKPWGMVTWNLHNEYRKGRNV